MDLSTPTKILDDHLKMRMKYGPRDPEQIAIGLLENAIVANEFWDRPIVIKLLTCALASELERRKEHFADVDEDNIIF